MFGFCSIKSNLKCVFIHRREQDLDEVFVAWDLGSVEVDRDVAGDGRFGGIGSGSESVSLKLSESVGILRLA